MKTFRRLVVLGLGAIALTLAGSARNCWAQNNEPADYPLGNRIFDRWVDNRRAARGMAPSYSPYQCRWMEDQWAGRGDFAPAFGDRHAFRGGFGPTCWSEFPDVVVNPMPVYGAPSPAAPDNAAHIRVVVTPDAKVWFDDSATKQTGQERLFESPPLTPGRDFTYEVKAQWRDQDGKEVTRTRRIRVRANAGVNVDFMQPAE